MTGRLSAFMTKVLSDPEKGHFSAKRICKRKRMVTFYLAHGRYLYNRDEKIKMAA